MTLGANSALGLEGEDSSLSTTFIVVVDSASEYRL